MNRVEGAWNWLVVSPRRLLLSCLTVAVLLAVPGLFTGAFVDDYFHIATIEGLLPFGSPWGLFDFAPGDPAVLTPRIAHGPFPWYTLPEMKARFFRPLSSALSVADHAVFGRHLIWWHLHSVLWYLLLIAACQRVFRRTLPGPVAVLALVLFTVDDVHWFPTVWLANRNALVAVSCALWGFVAHLRWREDGWRPGLPLSLAGYAAGLCGGEAALGVLAYVPAYELLGASGRWPSRLRGFLPAAMVAICYLGIYKALGYGSFGSGSYIDPVAEPLSYLAHAPSRIMQLIAGQLLGFPIDLSVFMLWLRPVDTVAGIAACVVAGILLYRMWPRIEAREQRALRWMIPGALLSLLPVAATFPTGRLLLSASLGGSVVVACILADWWRNRRVLRGRRWTAVIAGLLIAVHLVLAPIGWIAQSGVIIGVNRKVVQAALAAEMKDESDGWACVVLTGPDPLVSVYTPIIRLVNRGRPLSMDYSWLVLSQAPYAHRITRRAANCLEMEVVDGSMLGTEFERLFRSARFPLRAGQRVEVAHCAITVIEEGVDGPTKILAEFDRPLDDPSLQFLEWKDGCLRKAQIPEVGESRLLQRAGGLI